MSISRLIRSARRALLSAPVVAPAVANRERGRGDRRDGRSVPARGGPPAAQPDCWPGRLRLLGARHRPVSPLCKRRASTNVRARIPPLLLAFSLGGRRPQAARGPAEHGAAAGRHRSGEPVAGRYRELAGRVACECERLLGCRGPTDRGPGRRLATRRCTLVKCCACVA